MANKKINPEKGDYIHWHIITNINPKAKRLMKSKLKDKQILALYKKLAPIEYLTNSITGKKKKYHETIYLGKTLRILSKEETKIQLKQLTKDLTERLKKEKQNIS
ncbi:hypothetical protein GQ473_03830 [archaeon]|nr:hypothetical protein [archaeon]